MKQKVFRQASDLSQAAQHAFILKASKLIFAGILVTTLISLVFMSFRSFWNPQSSMMHFLIYCSSSFLLTYITRVQCFSLEDKKLQIASFFTFISLQSLCIIGAMKSVECICGAYVLIILLAAALVVSLKCFKTIKRINRDKALLKRFNHCQFGSMALFVLTSCWFFGFE